MKKIMVMASALATAVLLSGCVANDPPAPPTQGYGGGTGYNSYTVGYSYGDGDIFGGYGNNTGYGGWASSYYTPVSYPY